MVERWGFLKLHCELRLGSRRHVQTAQFLLLEEHPNELPKKRKMNSFLETKN